MEFIRICIAKVKKMVITYATWANMQIKNFYKL